MSTLEVCKVEVEYNGHTGFFDIRIDTFDTSNGEVNTITRSAHGIDAAFDKVKEEVQKIRGKS
jgi:hypothetical protein